MRLVMLSGNSLHNRGWIYEAEKHLADMFDGTYIQSYHHWSTGEPWIDLPRELDALRDFQTSAKSDYSVFAKSIGAVLAVQAMAQHIIEPKWLLLCGLPLGYITKKYTQFTDELAETKIPVTIIHNELDPVGEAKEVKAYLSRAFEGRTDFTFITTPGSTHDYEDFDLLRAELRRLLDKHGHGRD